MVHAAHDAAQTLRVTEVFLSLQGETSLTGLPTVFVRLTGCPLRCRWCDTEYAFSGGRARSIPELLDAVAAHAVGHVTVTGGEPLAQPGTHALMTALADAGYDVSLETSGAMDIAAVDSRVRRIVDVKAPGSGETHRNLLSNLALLGPRDEVKFVLADREDYRWARGFVGTHDLSRAGGVLFSPVYGELEPRTLADWIVADHLPVRMQIQLHKLLWGDEPGR